MQEYPQRGSTAEVFLPRLVARMHREGFEGVVRINDGDALRAIYFKGGEIASAASNEEADRLQSLLIQEGRLTLPQVDMARSRQQPGVSLGKTLIEMGFLSPSELLDCARRQVRQILATCFALANGEFLIEPGPLPPEVTILGLPSRRLILEALMEVADRQRIVGEMGSMETVYHPTNDLPSELGSLRIDPAMEEIAQRVDGVRSLRDLSGATTMDDFTLSKLVLGLEILGLVERKDGGQPTGAVEPRGGRIIPIESGPDRPAQAILPGTDIDSLESGESEAGAIPIAAPIDADPEPRTGSPEPAVTIHDPTGGIAPGAGTSSVPAGDPPPFPAEDLPAFAATPLETPDWNVDRRTGARIHEGPIEMTFDGLVRSREKAPSGSGRLIGLSAGVVALVAIAFFVLMPQTGTIDRGTPVAPAEGAGTEEIADARSMPPPGAGVGTGSGRSRPTASPRPRGRSAVKAPPPKTVHDDPADTIETTRPAVVEPSPAGRGSSAEPTEASPTPASTAGSTPPVVLTQTSSPLPNQAAPPVAPEPSAAPPPSTGPAAGTVGATPQPDRAAGLTSPFRHASEYSAATGLLAEGHLDLAADRFQSLVRSEGTGGYSLQLMIACEPATIEKARAQSGPDSQLYILPFTFNGRGCYRACWGVYPSRQVADDSVSGLPGAFSEAGLKPIAVSMARLQGPA